MGERTTIHDGRHFVKYNYESMRTEHCPRCRSAMHDEVSPVGLHRSHCDHCSFCTPWHKPQAHQYQATGGAHH